MHRLDEASAHDVSEYRCLGEDSWGSGTDGRGSGTDGIGGHANDDSENRADLVGSARFVGAGSEEEEGADPYLRGSPSGRSPEDGVRAQALASVAGASTPSTGISWPSSAAAASTALAEASAVLRAEVRTDLADVVVRFAALRAVVFARLAAV